MRYFAAIIAAPFLCRNQPKKCIKKQKSAINEELGRKCNEL